MWEYFLFGSLKNYSNLSEFSMTFTIDLSNEFPPPFVASSLYQGSCFTLNNGLRSNISRFLFLLKQRIEVSNPNLIVERSWVPFRDRIYITWYGEDATNGYESPFDKSIWKPQEILNKFG